MSTTTTSKPTFYYMLESPAARIVIAVARILGVDLELKRVELRNKEQLTPEFLKINPFHCIPTFVDTDGFILWESRVIATYLIQSRAPTSPLYPVDDLKKRSTIEKFLHYDLGGLYRALSDVQYAGRAGLDMTPKAERLTEVLKTLEDFVGQNSSSGQFIAGGTELTVADIAIHFDLCYLDFLPVKIEQFPMLKEYNERVEKALKPYNQDGIFEKAREDVMKRVAEIVKMMAEEKEAAAKK